MKSFTEILMEAAPTKKKISFSTYVKEAFKKLTSERNMNFERKVSITSAKKESGNFKVYKTWGDIPSGKNVTDEEIDAKRNEFRLKSEDFVKKILVDLNCPPALVNAKRSYTFKWNNGNFKEQAEVTFTDTKSGYQVTVEITFGQSYYTISTHFDVSFEGNNITQKGLTFAEYPEFVPGAILHASWGHNMTINTFYEIIRRTNKTVYVIELGNKKLSGGGYHGEEVPNTKQRGKEVFSGKIDNGYVKIDHNYCKIYDGKPAYYNSMD